MDILTVNNADLSDLLIHDTPLDFQFSDSPGQITYIPLSTILLHNTPDERLNPLNPYSPLYESAFRFLDFTYQGEFGTYTGIILDITPERGKVTLEVTDSFSQKLSDTNVITSFSALTPIELLEGVLQQFDIATSFDNSTAIRAWQLSAGLVFDLDVLPSAQIKLQELVNRICQVGFMRVAMFNNVAYVATLEAEQTVASFLDTEILSWPTQRRQSGSIHNGGSVTPLAGGPVIVAPTAGINLPALNLDLSGPPLTLLNDFGAESLIQIYSDPSNFARYYTAVVDYRIAYSVAPGSFVTIAAPILHPTQAVAARLVGRKRRGAFAANTAECTFEVRIT